MCAGIPSFEALAATLPPNGDVIFVGPEPREAPGGDFFEFFRRFFCVQYVLAPVVVHFAFAPSLLTHDRAGTVTTFVIDARRDHADMLSSLHALASRRGQSMKEEAIGTDFAAATMSSR
jgi:hypothetical protein